VTGKTRDAPRWIRRLVTRVSTSALVLTAAGCGQTAADSTAPAATPPRSVALSSAMPILASGSAAAPTAGAGGQDHVTQLASPSAYPSSDDAGRRDAQAAAAAAMQAFARHDLPTPLWWAVLAPLLSPAAVQAYQGVDPAKVPAHQVTGGAYPTGDTGTPYLARVAVPTDAGDYVVLLSRAGQGQRWLVERLTPPPRR